MKRVSPWNMSRYTCKQQETANLTSHLCLAPLYIILRPPQVSNPFLFLLYWLFPPLAKDIMKASCSCCDLLLCGLCRQNTAQERSHCLSAQLFYFFPSMKSPQRKLSSFWEHNGGANVRDSRGLNLERQCFVTGCKASHLSEMMFVFILSRSLVSEMDHGVVVSSLEEVCSFLVNMLPCSRQLSPRHLAVWKHHHSVSALNLNFYFPGQESDIQWSQVCLQCTQLNN